MYRTKTDEELKDDDEFQYGANLLCEIKTYDKFIQESERPLLRDFVQRLKKYYSFTPKQKQYLLNILEELKKRQFIEQREEQAANEPCIKCDSRGYIYARHKENKNRYLFSCDCHIARLANKNWPNWFNTNVSMFERI